MSHDEPTQAQIESAAQEQEDHLDQGGIWHANGTQPCATGRPYPHNNTPECAQWVSRRQPDLADQLFAGIPDAIDKIHAKWLPDGYQLPTVANLQTQLADARRLLDEIATSNRRLTRERDDARAAGQAYRRQYHAIADRDLRRVGAQLTQLETHHADLIVATAELIDAISDSDIQGPHRGHIDNLAAKASHVLLGGAPDTTRVTLTDEGERYLASVASSSSDTRSVARVTQESRTGESPQIEGSEVNGGHSKGVDYTKRRIMVSRESLSPPDPRADVKVFAPQHLNIADSGETREPVTTVRYKMATHAFHSHAGDITRDRPALALITGEDEDDFIGQFVEGYGLINVRFPKGTTRDLTLDERDLYDGKSNGYWIVWTKGDPR